MAKDDNKQGNSLLGSIVSELKQLNRASVKDKLRDAEALKRAESLAASQVMQAQESGAIVTDAQDFQRRFLAGQSRTEFNAAIKDRPAKYFAQQTLIRHSEIQTQYLKDIAWLIADDPHGLEISHQLNDVFQLLSKRWTGSMPAEPASSSTGGFSSEMLDSVNLVKVNSDALVQTSSKIKNINHQILDFLKADKLDRLQQFNTSQRSAEEARREAIKNAGRGSGTGMPTGSGTGEEGEEVGGIFNWLKNNQKIAGGIGAVALFRKWFGFGTKRGFIKTMKLRFKLLGRKLFPKSKPGLSKNPRMWPLLLVGIIASSFANAGDAAVDEFSAEQSDTADGSAGASPDGSDASIFTFNNAVNAALIASMLPLKSMRTRVVAGMKLGLTKMFKGAGKNTLRGKMWKAMSKPTNWLKVGKNFLRFFGPWGLAAFAVIEIVDWRLNAIKNQQKENDDLMTEMNAVDSEAGAADFMSNVDMSKFKFKEQGPMQFANPNTKSKNNVRMLLQTVAKNKAAQEVYIQELMKQGWDEKTLRGMAASINNPSTTMTSNINTRHPAYIKQQKLLEEKAKSDMMGGLSLWTKDYAPMDLMDDSIQYGTGNGIYGNGGDQIMGGAVYGPVNNIHNETVYIIPPKENIHKPGGFSDIRLKEDIKLIGKSPSDINIYEFKYIGEEGKYEGVMAQEVPWASSIADNGFLWVDYTKLDVDFIRLN